MEVPLVVTCDAEIFVDDMSCLLRKGDIVIMEEDPDLESEEEKPEGKKISRISVSDVRKAAEKPQKKTKRKKKVPGAEPTEVYPVIGGGDPSLYEMNPSTGELEFTVPTADSVVYSFMEFPEDISFDPDEMMERHGPDVRKWPEDALQELASAMDMDLHPDRIARALVQQPTKDEKRARSYMTSGIRDYLQTVRGSDLGRNRKPDHLIKRKPWQKAKKVPEEHAESVRELEKEWGPVSNWSDKQILMAARKMNYTPSHTSDVDLFFNTIANYAKRMTDEMLSKKTDAGVTKLHEFANENWGSVLQTAASEFGYTADDIDVNSMRKKHVDNLKKVVTKILIDRFFENLSGWGPEELEKFIDKASPALRKKLLSTMQKHYKYLASQSKTGEALGPSLKSRFEGEEEHHGSFTSKEMGGTIEGPLFEPIKSKMKTKPRAATKRRRVPKGDIEAMRSEIKDMLGQKE